MANMVAGVDVSAITLPTGQYVHTVAPPPGTNYGGGGGFFGSIFGGIGSVFSNIGGEVSHIVNSIGGEVGTVYAHVLRPALPIAATIASAMIPGGQVATPYLIAADVGLYSHAAVTGGFHGLTEPNLGDYEAGAIAAATYGAGQVYNGYITGGTAINSTQLTENLGNPSYNPLNNTFLNPLNELGYASNSVYNNFAGIGKGIEGGLSLAEGGLTAYNNLRGAAGQPTINILGQIQPSMSGLPSNASNAMGLPGGAQQAQQELGGSSAGITGAAGGGIGLPGQNNSSLIEIAALAAIGGAVLAS